MHITTISVYPAGIGALCKYCWECCAWHWCRQGPRAEKYPAGISSCSNLNHKITPPPTSGIHACGEIWWFLLNVLAVSQVVYLVPIKEWYVAGMCFSSICVRTYHACEETLECVGHEPSRIPSTHKGVIYVAGMCFSSICIRTYHGHAVSFRGIETSPTPNPSPNCSQRDLQVEMELVLHDNAGLSGYHQLQLPSAIIPSVYH